MLRAALGDIRRLRRIAVVLARHGFRNLADNVVQRSRMGGAAAGPFHAEEGGLAAGDDKASPPQGVPAGGGPNAPDGAAQDLPVATRLRMALDDLGATFVKLGQVLSTRPDLLPASFIAELSRLQDQAEPVPFPAVRAEVERGLGRPIAEVFDSFDPVPLASASIAQTHRARLKDGTEVVVKVQRPGIEEVLYSDLDLLYLLAGLMDATIEEARLYDPVSIVREFEKALVQELDFTNEAANMRRIHDDFRGHPWLVVPAPYESLSCRTVLTMDYLDGVKISAFQGTPEEKQALARRIVEIAYRMVFKHGFFHADPHPGNILVLPGGRVGLLDFGLAGRVSPKMQDSLVLLSLGIYLRDVPGLSRILYRLGESESRVNLGSFRRDIQTILDRYLGLELRRIDARNFLSDLLDLAVRYRIRVPAEYALLAKAGSTVEGVIRMLHPDMNLMEEARPYAHELLSEKYGPRALADRSIRLLLGMGGLLQDIPQHLDQLLMDLEGGRLTIRTENPALDRLHGRLGTLGTRVFLGLVGCGMLVSTAIVAVSGTSSSVLTAFLLLSWAALTIATTWHFAQDRLRKVRLTRVMAVGRRLSARRRARRAAAVAAPPPPRDPRPAGAP